VSPTIVDIINNDGHDLRYVAATYGGEWCGPCPWCGGDDRFRLWPEQGRYWCRQCNRSGDAIRYLLQFKGLSLAEIQTGYNIPILKTSGRGKPWKPKTAETPNALWKIAAESFLTQTQRNLWSEQGSRSRQWLKGRGLSKQTITTAGLGYSSANQNQPKQKWGIQDSGKSTNVWTPPGIVIPHRNSEIDRLRVRRNDGSYIIVTGSSSAPMVWDNSHDSYVIVESELDGILLSQEAGDLINVIALGSVNIRPDLTAHEKLANARSILVALDFDQAGMKSSHQWWLKNYPQAKRWPVPVGKDPGEAYQKGLNLRKWIEAGL
jgi:DNA primase